MQPPDTQPDNESAYQLGNSLKDQQRWEEAAAQYRRVLERDPQHARALNNLGTVHEALGQGREATDCYRRSIERDPRLFQPYSNLGRLLQSQGNLAAATQVFASALAAGADPDYFGHLASAAKGAATPRAPESYVRGTFDAFAPHFDRQLGELGYRVPQSLATLVRAHGWYDAGLDLGCGTGLAGEALAGAGGPLVGVDLSEEMLALARRRKCYAELHATEIGAWLGACDSARFDLVIAADVFIYIGALEDIFRDVARCLRPGGAFAFSVESADGEAWTLRPTGRYAQSPAYIARLATANGLSIKNRETTVIREGIAGELYLLVRP